MLRLLKVAGDSLLPEFQEGDFVLVSRIPFLLSPIKAGDVVAFRHPMYGTLIKRVERVAEDGESLFVVGTHPNSVDSRQFGAIRREEAIGKLLWHIKKPRNLA